jgi:anti-anti-sigma factor
MTIRQTHENGKLTLSLEGRLDTTTSPQFQDTLISAFDEAKEIVLDFAKLVYVSSAGLRALLIGQKTASAKSASLMVCNVSGDVMEVLDMTGFSTMLTIA